MTLDRNHNYDNIQNKKISEREQTWHLLSTQSRRLSRENQSSSCLLLSVTMPLLTEATLSLLILGRAGGARDDPCQDAVLLPTLAGRHSDKRRLLLWVDEVPGLCVWGWERLGLSLGRGRSEFVTVDLGIRVCVWASCGFWVVCLSCSLACVSAAVSSSLSSHSRLTVSSRKDF